MAEAQLTIRDATTDDVETLGALGKCLYRIYFAHLWSEQGFSRFVEGEFDEASMRRDIAEQRASYYLIGLDGDTIGFAKTKPEQLLPQSDLRGTELEKLYLRPEYTSGGLGQWILGDLVRRAEASGAGVIWLDVLKTNARARRAYEKAGFVVSGEVPFATDREEIGFFIMHRTPLPSARLASDPPGSVEEAVEGSHGLIKEA